MRSCLPPAPLLGAAGTGMAEGSLRWQGCSRGPVEMSGVKPRVCSAPVRGGYRASLDRCWWEFSCMGAAKARAKCAPGCPWPGGVPAMGAGTNQGLFDVLETCEFQEGLVGGRTAGGQYGPRQDRFLGCSGAPRLKNRRWREHPRLQSTGEVWDPQWSEEEEEGGLGGATILLPGAAERSQRRRSIGAGGGGRGRAERLWRWSVAPVPGCHQMQRRAAAVRRRGTCWCAASMPGLKPHSAKGVRGV